MEKVWIIYYFHTEYGHKDFRGVFTSFAEMEKAKKKIEEEEKCKVRQYVSGEYNNYGYGWEYSEIPVDVLLESNW